jgi:N-acetylmuramoyl-L-alanine amidase
MAPGRKSDPGPRFDWQRLARRGLAIWPRAEAEAEPDPTRFDADLTAFGYPEAPSETRLAAFRLRFRPGHAGPLDAADAARAADLARRFPIDQSAPSA